jgi:hypothetical protein
MLRLLSALIVLCVLVGFMSGLNPHLAQAQTNPAVGPGLDRPAEQPPALPEKPAGEVPKAQTSPAGTPTGFYTIIAKPAMWTALSVAVLVIGVGTLLYYAGRKATEPRILKLGPSFFFWLSLGYTGLLLIMAVAYNFSKYAAAPNSFLLNGILPVAVPWFGALGAVTISLEGIFQWNDDWKVKFNYWHIARPLFGAVLGIVAFFLFVVIVTASGTTPKFLETGKGQAKDFIIFYVLAFLVGYREETFRDLIKRATDLILKPGTSSAPSPAVSFKDKTSGAALQEVSLNAVRNARSSLTVEVQNTGNAPLVAPAVAVSVTPPAVAGTFGTANDQVTGGTDLAPGQARTVDVTFAPNQAGTFSGTLAVTATNLVAPGTIRIRGTAT